MLLSYNLSSPTGPLSGLQGQEVSIGVDQVSLTSKDLLILVSMVKDSREEPLDVLTGCVLCVPDMVLY